MGDEGPTSPGFQTLLSDLVENILRYADRPADCARYMTAEIRELIAVRMTALLRSLPDGSLELVDLCPRRLEPLWSRPEIGRFLELASGFDAPRLVDPRRDPEGEELRAAGIGTSFVIPLRIGPEPIGLLVLLDLMDEAGARIILETLVRVASILALVLRNLLHYGELERLVAERTAELSERERRWRTLFDQTAVGVALIEGSTGRYVQVNQRFADIVARAPEEVAGLSIADLTLTEDVAESLRLLDSLLAGEIREYSLDKRYLRPDGREVWANVTASAMGEAGSKPELVIQVVQDITEKKRSQEHIVAALREKEGLLRELFHRTKNTMQVIRSMIQLQAEEYPDSRDIRDFARITDDRIQAIALVHQMLYQGQDLSLVELRDYMSELVGRLRLSLGLDPGRIAISVDIEERRSLIDVAIPLGLILTELMTNTGKYAFPEGRAGSISIRFAAGAEGRDRLEYRDDGVGTPEGFDFRSQPSLGLKLIHSIGELQLCGRVEMDGRGGVSCVLDYPNELYQARV